MVPLAFLVYIRVSIGEKKLMRDYTLKVLKKLQVDAES